MPLSIRDLAKRLNVNESRARHLVQSGRIRGQKVGGRWLIDEVDAARYQPGVPAGRPLSERNAWLFALAACARDVEPPDFLVNVTPVEKHRLNQRIRRWEDESFSPHLLLSLLVNRAARSDFTASPADIPELKEDPRLRPSGVSHPGSGLLANSEVEAYVSREVFDAVVKDWFLVEAKPGQRPNVVLHVAEDVPDELPLLIVAADLAERSGAREQEAARELIRSVHAD